MKSSLLVSVVVLFANTILSLPTGSSLSLPKRQNSVPRLIQYVQTLHANSDPTSAPLSLLPLLNEGTGVTHVILAALHINGPNEIALNNDSPDSAVYDQAWSEVATLQQNGISVMIMVGGAAKGSYNGALCSVDDGSVQDDYYLPLLSMVQAHKLNGIDLDIEEDVNEGCPSNLVQRLKSDLGSGFTVTMAPVASDMTATASGLSNFQYKTLETSSFGQLVDWYNVQYYSGFVQTTIEGDYEAAVNNGFSPSRLGLGLLDSANDGSGFLDLADAQDTITNLKSLYSDFGGVDGWDYFDAGSSDGLSQPWMWVQDIGQTLFGSSPTTKRSRSHYHAPAKSAAHKNLMHEGFDQFEAAKALRYANDDERAARKILQHGKNVKMKDHIWNGIS